MLVFSVFGHFVILTIFLFLPKPSIPVKTIVPAFMVNLVETPSGQKQAAWKKPAPKPKLKKTIVKKKVVEKKVASKKPKSKPNKILKALKKLDKNAAAVAPLPAKKMIEELDQLASLEPPKKIDAKPKIKKPVLEETFRELEKLKN